MADNHSTFLEFDNIIRLSSTKKTELRGSRQSIRDDISKYFKLGSIEELQELLYYEWSEEKLQKLIEKGVKIEVYLGGNDKIIDASKAQEFFKEFATVYYIKEKGHLL